MKSITLSAVALTLALANGALAQQSQTGPTAYAPVVYNSYRVEPRHAATVAESQMRGYAAVVEAQAQWNLLTSQAMINAVEAQSRAIALKQQRLETQRNLREKYQQAKAAEYAARRVKPHAAAEATTLARH